MTQIILLRTGVWAGLEDFLSSMDWEKPVGRKRPTGLTRTWRGQDETPVKSPLLSFRPRMSGEVRGSPGMFSSLLATNGRLELLKMFPSSRV
jgi:hypothetical protein